MKTSSRNFVAVLAFSAVLLTACGGGGGDDAPAATSAVPDSASASVGGFIGYLQALVQSAADLLEPVDTAAVVPPTDETSEPQVID